MKLNSDCIRDVLLFLESQDNLVLDDGGNLIWVETSLEEIARALPKYSLPEVFYVIHNLDQADLIDCNIEYGSDTLAYCDVNFITYAGHEFLETIRDTQRWANVNKILGIVRDYSLSAVSEIARGMTSAAITAHLTKL